jgi:hypothetical protein
MSLTKISDIINEWILSSSSGGNLTDGMIQLFGTVDRVFNRLLHQVKVRLSVRIYPSDSINYF